MFVHISAATENTIIISSVVLVLEYSYASCEFLLPPLRIFEYLKKKHNYIMIAIQGRRPTLPITNIS